MNTRSQPGFGFEPLANRFPPSAPACYPAYSFQSPMLNSAENSQASVRSVHIQPNQAYGFMLPNALSLTASTSIIAPTAIVFLLLNLFNPPPLHLPQILLEDTGLEESRSS
ncbi:hypothetical protein AYI70_g8488 [Smittium culicis]|uniref:Uncharacterized protein n=1 Tax=Smittium culicis TaxID=133412 RepID=A0A1R1XFP9_9FUNG|nr:hypothetical protein AYI70_g8488 [Smittium culicis]